MNICFEGEHKVSRYCHTDLKESLTTPVYDRKISVTWKDILKVTQANCCQESAKVHSRGGLIRSGLLMDRRCVNHEVVIWYVIVQIVFVYVFVVVQYNTNHQQAPSF